MSDRVINILIPGIGLPLSLGTVYNYSQYSVNIMECFGISKSQADIGFTLIIFFLGMCAATFGRMVELNPKRMSVVSTTLFAIGMFTLFAATKFGILPLYYVGCSFMGAGTGIGYVCPIKQLLSNFSDHKGLASGLAITGFGAGKFVAAPAIETILANFELPYLFLILGCAFLTVMSVCSWLFCPNPAFITTKKKAIPFKDLVHTKFLTMEYVSIWIMFCINISCGLALIAQEKSLLKFLGFKEIALIMALTAVFNVLGRFGMSTLSDYIGRKGAYHYVCSLSILAAFLCYTEQAWLAICGIMMVEFAYGGNFSVLPSLLAMWAVIKFLFKNEKNRYVQYLYSGLRPAVVGLIFSAGLLMMVDCDLIHNYVEGASSNLEIAWKQENFGSNLKEHLISAAICIATFVAVFFYKKNPMYLIAGSGALGFAIYYL